MIGKIALSGLLCVCGAVGLSQPNATPTGEEPDGHVDPRDIVGKAKISLVDALQAALTARPGTAVEAELEGEVVDGATTVFFEVMVVGADGTFYEVRLDPASGGILSDEAAGADELEELAEFREVLRHTELGLVALLGKAGEVVRGFPYKVGLELEHGQPLCEVKIANGRYLIDADLEARAGHLVELELASGVEEEGDEEAGDEERGEEEGEAGREHRGHAAKKSRHEEEEEAEGGEAKEKGEADREHGGGR